MTRSRRRARCSGSTYAYVFNDLLHLAFVFVDTGRGRPSFPGHYSRTVAESIIGVSVEDFEELNDDQRRTVVWPVIGMRKTVGGVYTNYTVESAMSIQSLLCNKQIVL